MDSMAKYIRVSEGLDDYGQLIDVDELDFTDFTSDKDYYSSVYYYTDEHMKKFKQTGSVRGIRDVKTDKLVFDFDSEDNLELARKDSLEVISRLKKYNISESDLEYYFSGKKGFSVVLNLDHELTPNQAANLALNTFGKDLETLDVTMYNASRIFRVPGTKHQVSGLYKIPLTINQLKKLPIEVIKEKAREPQKVNVKTNKVKIPDMLLVEPVVVKKQTKVSLTEVAQPRGWKDYKWSIAQGNFESGERHHALMVLAATCRGLGYDRDMSLAMCKVAIQKQAERFKVTPFDEAELEENIIDQSVFSPTWEGGQYSPDSDPWLKRYCERLGFSTLEKDNTATVSITDAFDKFKEYAKNIDNLTIKTGIKPLDEKLRMTVGMSIALLAGPGAGKTSISLQILNNMSKSEELCIFFSYDMFHALVTQKLIQKHFPIDGEEIFLRYKSDDAVFQDQVHKVLAEEYKNVEFCFEAGQSIPQIEETIKRVEEKRGKKVKLIVCDYNELVYTDNSDATAASAYTAQNFRRIANVYQLCSINLYQPSKAGGSPADEIMSYRAAKGSSAIEQSVSVMIGVSRPGYDPRHIDDDKFMTINCVKNRMGKLFSLDLSWDGQTGMVRTMTGEEKSHLDTVRKRIKDEKAGDSEGWN